MAALAQDLLALQALQKSVEKLDADSQDLGLSVDKAWLIFGAALVFFMQAGFAMLESGTVRQFNVSSILFKNTMDGIIGAILFWSLGYSWAYGEKNQNSFIGSGNYFLVDISESNYAFWMFQWAFAATAATIVSGAVAERCRMSAYFAYTVILTAFIYPVVAHWGWSGCGWASAFNDGSNDDCPKYGQLGAIDFAGSGVVHMTGGFSALAGAFVLGPRKGFTKSTGAVNADGMPVTEFKPRWSDGVDDAQFAPHSIPLQALGVFILWFGWYGFNCVSTLGITGYGGVAAKVACTTTLGAAFGGLGSIIFNRILVAFKKRTTVWDISSLLNGVLAGLVSITAPCSVVEPWAAVVIGIVGGMTYVGASTMLKGLEIDDPLDAFPVHGACGLWGVISVGLFAESTNVINVYGTSLLRDGKHLNGFYDQDNGNQFDVQLCFALAIAAWAFGISFLIFFGMNKLNLLRIPEEDEMVGVDWAEGMGAAYGAYIPYSNALPSVQPEIVPHVVSAEDVPMKGSIHVINEPAA